MIDISAGFQIKILEAVEQGEPIKAVVAWVIKQAVWELMRHKVGKFWQGCLSEKKKDLDQIYAYDFGQEGQKMPTFADEVQGVTSLLKDCWPVAMYKMVKESNGKIQ